MRRMTDQDLIDVQTNFPLESCLKPPDLQIDQSTAQEFERLFDSVRNQGTAPTLHYDLPYPKYLFLEYLANTHGVMLHGSTQREIDVLKPIRNSNDSREFGDQAAIYMTQDPLWALFFAVLDRDAIRGLISNGAIHLQGDDGILVRRYYYSIEAESLRKYPWRPGAIYILPGNGAEPDPDMAAFRTGQYTLQVTHWLYRGELQPLAKLLVEPEDFPFVDRIWGYDSEVMNRRMEAESLAGWPFLDDPELYPILPNRE